MKIIYNIIILTILISSSCESNSNIETNLENKIINKLETLEEIKNYNFSDYDSTHLKDTKENISNLLFDSDSIFNDWKNKTKSEYDTINVEVDFDFYSAQKKGTEAFCKTLESDNFKVKINTKRMLLLFKGYEIRASSIRNWTKEELKYEIERLGLVARKYNCLIEGFGGLVKP